MSSLSITNLKYSRSNYTLIACWEIYYNCYYVCMAIIHLDMSVNDDLKSRLLIRPIILINSDTFFNIKNKNIKVIFYVIVVQAKNLGNGFSYIYEWHGSEKFIAIKVEPFSLCSMWTRHNGFACGKYI